MGQAKSGLNYFEEGYGYQIIQVQKNSPLYLENVSIFLDFIVGIKPLNGKLNTGKDFFETIALNEDQKILFSFYNVRKRQKYHKIIIPHKNWENSDSLLGAVLRYDKYLGYEEKTFKVLQVEPSSPGQYIGLMPETDFIIGCVKQRYENLFDLIDLIQKTERSELSLELAVFNTAEEKVRQIDLKPNSKWGGKGSVGCIFGCGILNQLPQIQPSLKKNQEQEEREFQDQLIESLRELEAQQKDSSRGGKTIDEIMNDLSEIKDHSILLESQILGEGDQKQLNFIQEANQSTPKSSGKPSLDESPRTQQTDNLQNTSATRLDHAPPKQTALSHPATLRTDLNTSIDLNNSERSVNLSSGKPEQGKNVSDTENYPREIDQSFNLKKMRSTESQLLSETVLQSAENSFSTSKKERSLEAAGLPTPHFKDLRRLFNDSYRLEYQTKLNLFWDQANSGEEVRIDFQGKFRRNLQADDSLRPPEQTQILEAQEHFLKTSQTHSKKQLQQISHLDAESLNLESILQQVTTNNTSQERTGESNDRDLLFKSITLNKKIQEFPPPRRPFKLVLADDELRVLRKSLKLDFRIE